MPSALHLRKVAKRELGWIPLLQVFLIGMFSLFISLNQDDTENDCVISVLRKMLMPANMVVYVVFFQPNIQILLLCAMQNQLSQNHYYEIKNIVYHTHVNKHLAKDGLIMRLDM